MTGEERRSEILQAIQEADVPISGTALAKRFHVSRQVVVQDIALLRAANYDIFSTTKGYLIHMPVSVTRVVEVCHADEEIEDELNTIVDLGGKVIDVFIRHEVYGSLRAPIGVSSRRNVQEFVSGISGGKSSPLKNLTSGKHWHTIEADSRETLDMIEEELRKKKYLIEEGSR